MDPRAENEITPSAIKTAVHEALNERERIDHELHKADHDFVREMRERYQARKDMWDKAKKSAIGAVVTATIGKLFFILYVIGDVFLDWLQSGPRGH